MACQKSMVNSKAIEIIGTVSKISINLVLQELFVSLTVSLVKFYSIFKACKKLESVDCVLENTEKAIPKIEVEIQNIKNEMEPFNKETSSPSLTNEMATKPDFLLKILKVALDCHQVYKKIAKLKITLIEKEKSLNSLEATLCRSIIITACQVVSHCTDFFLYWHLEMGCNFWAVKVVFTIVFTAITLTRCLQLWQTKRRFKRLNSTLDKVEQCERVVDSMILKHVEQFTEVQIENDSVLCECMSGLRNCLASCRGKRRIKEKEKSKREYDDRQESSPKQLSIQEVHDQISNQCK